MKSINPELITPIYLKTENDMPWPEEAQTFYLLSADGLFLCRNSQFFRSCTPARNGPSELANQETFLEVQYPKIPQALLELSVGFFAQLSEKYDCEAAVLLAWDYRRKQVQLLVPKQRCTVYQTYYNTYPIGVYYELPTKLPEGIIIFGDIHSHVDGAAYASVIDKHDEQHRPGLHIVVGRIREEPPEFHIEATVDGKRFKVDEEQVLEGYGRRAKVSKKFLDQVELVHFTAK
jgi:proteasome lid subunit RPN8/RPN11